MTKRTTYTLTAAFVKGVRHRGKRKSADRYHDRHGLHLQVMPSGSKQWIQRLVIDGKRSDYGLGGYPYITLGEARLQAFENVKLARAYRKARERGETPPPPPFEASRLATRARGKGQPAPATAAGPGLTFGQAFEMVLAERAPTWKEGVRASSLRSWRANLRDYLDGIAKLPIATLTSADLQACLSPVWGVRPKTAAKALSRAAMVLEWAGAAGLRTDNPARAVARAAPRPRANGAARKHFAALPHAEIAQALARVAECGAGAAVRGAFRLQVLTALRPGEARRARWEEIDLERAEWVIPAARMKASENGDHRVPLSPQALDVLRAADPREEGLVFPGRNGTPLSDSTTRAMLKRAGVNATPHGARSTFRGWAAEAGWPREVAEAALAHTVRGVEAAYMRTDLFERRRRLMAAWGDYATGGGR